jgi:hypothetical protein
MERKEEEENELTKRHITLVDAIQSIAWTALLVASPLDLDNLLPANKKLPPPTRALY